MKNTFKTKLLNIIKQAYYFAVSDDSENCPQGISAFNNRKTKFIRMSVYGICSNPPKESHILLLSNQSKGSNKFGFLNDFENRKKDLKEGEFALYNTLTEAYIYFKEDGSIEIDTPGDLTANVAGDASIISSGSVNVDAAKDINLTAPTVNIDGDLNVTGDTTVNGDISSDGDVIADALATAITLLMHYHQGNLGYPTGAAIISGGGTAPASLPTVESDGSITDGTGISSSEHTHPYTWTDPAGSGDTGAPE